MRSIFLFYFFMFTLCVQITYIMLKFFINIKRKSLLLLWEQFIVGCLQVPYGECRYQSHGHSGFPRLPSWCAQLTAVIIMCVLSKHLIDNNALQFYSMLSVTGTCGKISSLVVTLLHTLLIMNNFPDNVLY